MKKANIVLVIIVLILLLGCYFGYKCFYLYYYYSDNTLMENYEEYIDGLNIKDTILVQHQTVEDYLEFNGIKI